MKKTLPIIISIIVIGVLITGVIFATRTKKIPNNPPETIGNTSGNLNNGGYFCESNGVIYFSNFNDSHFLYKMDLNGSNISRLMDVPVSYINAGGDYLYFYYDDQGEAKFMGVAGNMRGIYRLNKDGKSDLVCLERSTSGIVNLIGSQVYYEHYDNTDGMTLYHTSLDGKDKGKLLNEIVNPACVVYGDILYPSTVDNFYLYSYTPGASNGRLHLNQMAYNPTLAGGYIYYMNVEDDYKLYRYDISQGIVTKVTSERVDTFNVHNNSIFYQRNQNPALIHMNDDGTGATIIAEGNYSNINCTSTYTFFTPYGSEDTVYMIPTDGYGSVTLFNP